MAIPFLNLLNSEIEGPFSDLALPSSRILGLVRSVLCGDHPPSLDEVVEDDADYMPSTDLFRQELYIWKHKFQMKPLHEQPAGAAEATRECDEDIFPKIFALLKLCCSIPASSGACSHT